MSITQKLYFLMESQNTHVLFYHFLHVFKKVLYLKNYKSDRLI